MNQPHKLILVGALIACSRVFTEATQPRLDGLPESLSKAIKYRHTVETARLEVVETDFAKGRDPIEPVRRRKTMQFTARETVIADLGDDEGVVLRAVDGTPAPVDSHRPFLALETIGRRIERSDNPLAQVRDREMGPRMRFDPRTIGMCASPIARELDEAILGDTVAMPVAPEYSESRDGNLVRVEARKSRSRITHWIDPKRGFTPVRVREDRDDGSWAESRSQLKRFGGIWFPEQVDYFSSYYADGARPVQTVEVEVAEINEPGQKKHLGPSDIGLEPGMDVVTLDSKLQTREIGKWDGTSVVSIDEFLRKLRKGEVREGERYVRAIREAAENSQSPPVPVDYSASAKVTDIDDMLTTQMRAAPTKTPELWEDFVRQFIKKHDLGEEQTQNALSILKDCQRQADAHLAANRERIESASATQLAPLLKPLERLFCDQLHPRLTKLLTRAQMNAASKPASATPQP